MHIRPGCSISATGWQYSVIERHTLNISLPMIQVPRRQILNVSTLQVEEQNMTLTIIKMLDDIEKLDLAQLIAFIAYSFSSDSDIQWFIDKREVLNGGRFNIGNVDNRRSLTMAITQNGIIGFALPPQFMIHM